MRQRLIILLLAAAAVGLLVASLYWPDPIPDGVHSVAAAGSEDMAPQAPKGDGPKITIFAAASTASVIQDIAQIYEQDVAVDIIVVPAASSVLARQIFEGAPADIFISANTQWTDYLINEGLADAESRRILMTNRLALVAPKKGEWSNEAGIGTSWDPKATLTEQLLTMILLGRLAICEPDSVPCGQYAKQTLKALGLWTRAQHSLAIGNNAQSTLAWIERGEVPGGLVYMTEVLASNDVELVTFVPDGFHEPILYDGVLLNTKDIHVRDFADYLQGTVAQRLLIAAGFIPTEIVKINTQSGMP